MKCKNSTEITTMPDSVEFWHNGIRYYASGVVIHQCYKVDSGIGSYEYWGHVERDVQWEYWSDYKDAEFKDIMIGDGEKDIDPTEEMLELAKESLWADSKTMAEEQAVE